MKKKIWIPIAAIVIVIAAVLFSGPVVVPFTGERTSDADGGIVMTAQFPVYDKSCDRLSVIIENNSDITAEFGDDWYLEKYVLGSWMNVPRSGEYYVNSILRILQPGGKFAFECGLKSFIGELDNGKYRVVKKINAETYSAEFEIGESEITLESPFGYETLLFGYDIERAEADGACGIADGSIMNEERLIDFLEASQISGLQAQLRIYTADDEGKLYYTDIVKLKHPVYRVTTWEQTSYDEVHMRVYASSQSNAREIFADQLEEVMPEVKYYNSLTTDGKAVWLSAYSDLREHDPDENDLCIIPKGNVTASVKDWIKNGYEMRTEELNYTVWNRSGTRSAAARVNPEDEEESRRYFVNIYSDNEHGTRGYTCGIQNGVFEMKKNGGIREFVWADETVLMMRAEDGKGNNYFEFYDTEAEERLSYTITRHGYRIENGEIIIEE